MEDVDKVNNLSLGIVDIVCKVDKVNSISVEDASKLDDRYVKILTQKI